MRAVLVLFAVSVLAAAPARADDNYTNGFYFGVGLGDFSTGGQKSSNIDGAGLAFESSAQKIFAGWRFNRFVALQIDHVDFERSVDAPNALTNFGSEAEGFAPSFVGLLPLGPVELFARGGLLWYDLETAGNDTSLADWSERDSIFGAGIGFTIAERLNLRAEYEVVEIDGLDDPNAVWLTAAWRF